MGVWTLPETTRAQTCVRLLTIPMGACLCVLMLLGAQDPRVTLSAASGPFWTIAQPEVKVCSMLSRVSLRKLALIFKCDLCEHDYVCVCFVFSLVPRFWCLFPFAPEMSFRGLSPPLGCILRIFLTMLRSQSLTVGTQQALGKCANEGLPSRALRCEKAESESCFCSIFSWGHET